MQRENREKNNREMAPKRHEKKREKCEKYREKDMERYSEI